eukprot:gene18590-24317_t
MYDPSQPPLISETHLKRRRSLEDLVVRRSLHVQNQNKKRRVIRGEDIKIKRPEQFVYSNKIRRNSLNKMNRIKRVVERKSVKLPPNEQKNTVGFIVRIHEAYHASREVKKELKQLKLYKKYDGVFYSLNKEGLEKLKPLDPYIAYGFLSEQSVIELVHRRAYTAVKGPLRPLNDNQTIETILGDKGILCLNDLSHEIYTVGEHFNDAIQILKPFKLSAPVGKFEKKILKVNDSVEEKSGFIGNKIEEFLEKIL